MIVTPGEIYSFGIGSGGVGSVGDGTDGEDTVFNTTLVVAKGGTGGGANDGGLAGLGNQSGVIGDVVYFGGHGTTSPNEGGGGGGGAGSTGSGGNASATIAGNGTDELGGDGGAGRLVGNSADGYPGKI